MKANEFRCHECLGVFEKAWPDDEARAEATANGFDPDADDIVTVCDDCHQQLPPPCDMVFVTTPVRFTDFDRALAGYIEAHVADEFSRLPTVVRCDCGARREAIEDTPLGARNPSYIPGPLLEPCTCPACAHCDRVLSDGRCENMDCPLYDVLVPR
jgi:hypothetical protein